MPNKGFNIIMVIFAISVCLLVTLSIGHFIYTQNKAENLCVKKYGKDYNNIKDRLDKCPPKRKNNTYCIKEEYNNKGFLENYDCKILKYSVPYG